MRDTDVEYVFVLQERMVNEKWRVQLQTRDLFSKTGLAFFWREI